MDPSPKDWGFVGLAWGDSCSLQLLGFTLCVTLREEAPPTSGVLCAPLRLRGLETSGTVFQALGLRGLSAFEDSLLDGAFFAGELGIMSWGTLHGSPQVTNKPRTKRS
jgi:hypothetical protein